MQRKKLTGAFICSCICAKKTLRALVHAATWLRPLRHQATPKYHSPHWRLYSASKQSVEIAHHLLVANWKLSSHLLVGAIWRGATWMMIQDHRQSRPSLRYALIDAGAGQARQSPHPLWRSRIEEQRVEQDVSASHPVVGTWVKHIVGLVGCDGRVLDVDADADALVAFASPTCHAVAPRICPFH